MFTQEIIEAGFKPIGEEKDLLKESYFVRFEKTGEKRRHGVAGNGIRATGSPMTGE